jgi:PAS domain S-box-containing protein
MDGWMSLLGRNGLLPHGFCLQWAPHLLWTMVLSDAVIALAYFSIPVAIVSFVRRRSSGDQPFGWLPWLFSGFIFACGLTHVMDVWTLWQPDYALQTLSKLLTAGVSAVTAVALWPLIPRALQIPSVNQLQGVIRQLESEVGRRRTAEDHLRDTEQSLAVTLGSIEAGVIVADRAGRITRMNEVAERITGWQQQQAVGRRLVDVFVQPGQPAGAGHDNPVDALLAHEPEATNVHEARVLARDGTESFVDLRQALTRDEHGQVRGIVLVLRDVTRLRRAEAELPRLAAIVEGSGDAIIAKTLDGRITSWNPAAEKLFGWTAAEAIGQPVQMLFPPGTEDQEMRFLAALARGERVLPFDTTRRAKDGTEVAVSVSISPVRDTQGRIVGASKIARDISATLRAKAALRDSEARLRFALEAAQIGDWELDLDTGATRRSLRHDRCFGYREQQAAWNVETMLRHVHPADRDGVAAAFQQSLDTGQDWHSEFRVVWPDGSLHWLAAHARMQQAGTRRMLGIVTDITQAKRSEEARILAQRLEAENQQIQAASRLKSQFLANMSHELRTPLNAIIGFADLLHAGAVPVESAKHREFLGHIGTSGRHLLQLINNVLDLSKVESGKFEFFPQAVDLQELVAEVAGVLHPGLQLQRLQLHTEIAPGLQDLVLDPARLKQVLYNYLSNAIKFTPEGGSIVLRAQAEGADHLRIEVQDTGIGIAPGDLPRLFVEFQQLDSGYAKRHAGTGLGLALTRRLVQTQGGSVGVRSRPGEGSVFHLVLPRRPGIAPAPVPSLLLVHDDPAHRQQVATPLGAAGCSVDAASTASQALARASTRRYDGIALGLRLPDQDGLGLLADIRAGDGTSRDAPVVGLSMHTAGQPPEHVVFGITDVLAKPLQTRQVLRAMAACGLQGGSQARVMVIDDDPLALDLMLVTLQTAGLQAAGWADGREALLDIDQHQPHAIVLDLMMPGFDGFAVLDTLSRLPAWRATPVFIWTSMLLTDEEFQGLALSAQAVLSKGSGDMAWLLERLRRAAQAQAAAPGAEA